MKRLTLVRHGQAEWKEAAIADFERPLTRRGLAEAADMARRLRVQDAARPDLVLTSAAVRAVQTATTFARELELADRLVKRLDTLYLAPADELLAAVRDTGTRVDHLLLIGHNPGLSEFAQRLAPNAGLETFATGACCALHFAADDWQIEYGAARDTGYDAPGRFFDLWH